jgi:phosphate transport system protein
MRDAYSHQLDAIINDLVAMANHVRGSLHRATQALLTADAPLAEEVITGDEALDTARRQVEEYSFELMALQQPVAGDLRTLVASLRIVADLERMGDLTVHIAKIARLRVPGVAVPDEMIPMFERASEVAEKMIEFTARVIGEKEIDNLAEIEAADEEMDLIRRRGFELMLSPDWAHGVEPAIDAALLGRYYERIADHAVSICRRVVFQVTGEGHPS